MLVIAQDIGCTYEFGNLLKMEHFAFEECRKSIVSLKLQTDVESSVLAYTLLFMYQLAVL